MDHDVWNNLDSSRDDDWTRDWMFHKDDNVILRDSDDEIEDSHQKHRLGTTACYDVFECSAADGMVEKQMQH